MSTSFENIILLIRQKKFQDAYYLSQKVIEENPDDLRVLLTLSWLSQNPLEATYWAYKAYQKAPNSLQVQKAWAALPPIPTEILVHTAGKVNWHIRRINLPIQEAVNSGQVTLKDLSWATYKLHNNRLVRWAASVYGAQLQKKLTKHLTAPQALDLQWPFKNINLPIGQALRESKIDFGDLCYAVLNGRDELPAAAAIVSGLIIYDDLTNTVLDNKPTPHSIARQKKAPKTPQRLTKKAGESQKPVQSKAQPKLQKKSKPAVKPDSLASQNIRRRTTGGPLEIIQGSTYLREKHIQTQKKKLQLRHIGQTLLVLATLITIGGSVTKIWWLAINHWC